MGSRKLSYHVPLIWGNKEIAPKKMALISKGNTGNFSENSSENSLDYFLACPAHAGYGMLLPNTNIDPNTGAVLADGSYRYGFQGQELDNEIKGEGNSVASFSATNVNQKRWMSNDDCTFEGFELRLNARLIEKMVEESLIDAGYNEEEVRKDVIVLQSDDARYKGKFASFEEGTQDKYIKDWDKAEVSAPHESIEGKTSGLVGGTSLKMKYYDGAKSDTDDAPNQIQFVQAGTIDHMIEGVIAYFTNIGVDNAKTVKADAEKRNKDARKASSTPSSEQR